jgi:hypothetical protein
MMNMTQNTPAMRRSRLDVLSIIEAHRDADAVDVMEYMINFEREMSLAVQAVRDTLREKRNLRDLVSTFNDVLVQALIMGATDLEAVTRSVLDGITSGDSARALARALSWTTIAEETRSSNMMLFQACLLFGRAPNGKAIPDLDEPEEQ